MTTSTTPDRFTLGYRSAEQFYGRGARYALDEILAELARFRTAFPKLPAQVEPYIDRIERLARQDDQLRGDARDHGAVPAPADTSTTVTLNVDVHGRVDRLQALTAFAEGRYIEPVFGPARPLVAASLVGHVRGIMPTKTDVIRNAYGDTEDRRVRAYRNGREYLLTAYYGYEGVADLPALESADLPEA